MSLLATPGMSQSVRVSTTKVTSALRSTARNRLRIRRQLSRGRSSARQRRRTGTSVGSWGLMATAKQWHRPGSPWTTVPGITRPGLAYPDG
jgi:hypothetical protein